jgi:hypothetical protein
MTGFTKFTDVANTIFLMPETIVIQRRRVPNEKPIADAEYKIAIVGEAPYEIYLDENDEAFQGGHPAGFDGKADEIGTQFKELLIG